MRVWLRSRLNRESLKEDSIAGVVLGVQSVPDGLAGGLLAGVNPVYGLYAYMVGTFTGGLFTSASFMAVQATGAMAIVVADVPAVHDAGDPERALFTLSIITGVIMLTAGLFRLGKLLRWVSNAVMVGFINAVGVNIVLGQLENFSGFQSNAGNRITSALDLLLNLGQAHWPSLIVGGATIALIVVLERTRLGALGMVVAIVGTSAFVALSGWDGVLQLSDITEVPGSLPLPVLPDFSLTIDLILPALALAFVGLVQGAGISANFPNPDGTYADASQDFVGQGAANVAVGLLQGMPVGGSMSASALVKAAGARSRTALLIAGVVMAISIVAFAGAVEYIAMPALAGLLMLVGYRTVKPHDIVAVWKTGAAQAVTMAVTFALTMLIPLQSAVLVGVGISVILFVIRQSGTIAIKRRTIDESGDVREEDPPRTLGRDEVVVLQPYGNLFFASAPVFDEQLPEVTGETRNSVVVIRLRGQTDLGSTLMEVLSRYGAALRRQDSKLMLIYSDDKIRYQLEATGLYSELDPNDIYRSDEWLGRTMKRAHRDAEEWVKSRRSDRSE